MLSRRVSFLLLSVYTLVSYQTAAKCLRTASGVERVGVLRGDLAFSKLTFFFVL